MTHTDLGPARRMSRTTCPWQRRCQRIQRIAQRSELLDRPAMAREINRIYRIASGIDVPAVKRKGRRA